MRIRPRRRARPAVPFVLALPHRGSASPGGTAGELAVAAMRARQAKLAEALARIEAACWRGELGRKELWRLQELRVAFAALAREIEKLAPAAERVAP
jgi:hypothetical protein